MTGDDTKTTVIRLPGPLHEWLRRSALEQDTSMNKLVIAAIEEKRDRSCGTHT